MSAASTGAPRRGVNSERWSRPQPDAGRRAMERQAPRLPNWTDTAEGGCAPYAYATPDQQNSLTPPGGVCSRSVGARSQLRRSGAEFTPSRCSGQALSESDSCFAASLLRRSSLRLRRPEAQLRRVARVPAGLGVRAGMPMPTKIEYTRLRRRLCGWPASRSGNSSAHSAVVSASAGQLRRASIVV